MADYPLEVVTIVPLEIPDDGELVQLVAVDMTPAAIPPCREVPLFDEVPPVVTFVSPLEGTQIEAGDALVFDVTDDSGTLGRVLVVAFLSRTADQELAHDGAAFTARYAARSTRTAIANGFRFSLRRTGGWPTGTTVTVRVFAVDPSGNLET